LAVLDADQPSPDRGRRIWLWPGDRGDSDYRQGLLPFHWLNQAARRPRCRAIPNTTRANPIRSAVSGIESPFAQKRRALILRHPEAAVDAFHHIDLVAGCAPHSVVAPGSPLRWLLPEPGISPRTACRRCSAARRQDRRNVRMPRAIALDRLLLSAVRFMQVPPATPVLGLEQRRHARAWRSAPR
jgi:hypothetical protein